LKGNKSGIFVFGLPCHYVVLPVARLVFCLLLLQRDGDPDPKRSGQDDIREL